MHIVHLTKHELYLNESILRTGGARGISMNKEFVKNDILRRASRLVGTSMADSLTVKSKYRRLIYNKCKHNKRVICCRKDRIFHVYVGVLLYL